MDQSDLIEQRRLEQRIEERIARCREKLATIDAGLASLRETPFKERPRTLAAFLSKERAVYAFALGELESLMPRSDVH